MYLSLSIGTRALVHYVRRHLEPALPAAFTLLSPMTCPLPLLLLLLVDSTHTLQSPGDPRRGGMSLLLAHLTHKIGQASCQLGICCPIGAELILTELH